MGSNDGAEVSELVGLYLINVIGSDKELWRLGVSVSEVELYWDDGLKMLNSGTQNLNKIRQRLEKVFFENQLEIKVTFGSQTTIIYRGT